MQARQATIDYVAALNAKLGEVTKTHSYSFDYAPGRSYDRIIMIYTDFKESFRNRTTAHAFVDRASDGLIKCATYKAPQRNADGTLAIRYRLDTPEQFQKTVDAADTTGHYLYANA